MTDHDAYVLASLPDKRDDPDEEGELPSRPAYEVKDDTSTAEFWCRIAQRQLKMLAKVTKQRDDLAGALEALAATIDEECDIDWNGGPNQAMRLVNEHGDRVSRALKAVGK